MDRGNFRILILAFIVAGIFLCAFGCARPAFLAGGESLIEKLGGSGEESSDVPKLSALFSGEAQPSASPTPEPTPTPKPVPTYKPEPAPTRMPTPMPTQEHVPEPTSVYVSEYDILDYVTFQHFFLDLDTIKNDPKVIVTENEDDYYTKYSIPVNILGYGGALSCYADMSFYRTEYSLKSDDMMADRKALLDIFNTLAAYAAEMMGRDAEQFFSSDANNADMTDVEAMLENGTRGIWLQKMWPFEDVGDISVTIRSDIPDGKSCTVDISYTSYI